MTPTLQPGAHAVVVGSDLAALEARARGLAVRDSFLIVYPSGVLTAWLVRSPLTSPTVASQWLTTGTGALATGVSRIPIANTSRSRWPTNVLLVHCPGCERDHDVWTCVPRCPARSLDEQSGERPGSGLRAGQAIAGMGYSGGASGMTVPTDFGGDTGGASRFYPQFANIHECLAWLGRLVSPEEKTVSPTPTKIAELTSKVRTLVRRAKIRMTWDPDSDEPWIATIYGIDSIYHGPTLDAVMQAGIPDVTVLARCPQVSVMGSTPEATLEAAVNSLEQVAAILKSR